MSDADVHKTGYDASFNYKTTVTLSDGISFMKIVNAAFGAHRP